jgi:hypothetical protein
MIFKIFSPKSLAKILAFIAKTNTSFCKNLIITLVFEKNANIFAENCQKSQKIEIITSTPDRIFDQNLLAPKCCEPLRNLTSKSSVCFSGQGSGLPDGLFPDQKIQIWVYFGGT